MAININCIREDHNDSSPSAILNDSMTDRFAVGTVYCFGCGKWYHIDDPESSFYSYSDLMKSIKEFGVQNRSKSKLKFKKKISSKNGLEIEKFPTLRSSQYEGPYSGHKSRLNLYGQTLKSNVKDDSFIINKEGKKIFINKIPKVANDLEGTHETVKEFLWSESKEKIDVIKGFLNRIIVDSDDTVTPLEKRLEKVCSVSSVKGFWLILNRNNQKF